MNHHRRICALTLALIFCVALWLRVPGISTGLPYLYEEDEAHHFNRVVEMVKNKDFNPRYFHKPSLHFYLRMPVVALTYLWLKQHGEIESLKELRTRDAFGLAGYNFTASHALVAKTSRSLSVLMSLVAVLIAGLLCLQLGGSLLGAASAALLTALAPDFLKHSPIIGVDVLMALMCLIAMWVGMSLHKSFSVARLCICAVFAGLAVSSKYNALPVAGLPLILCWLHGPRTKSTCAIAAFVPILAFFAASPYILVSLPLFIKQLGYEIWHYGVAGHVGHEATPGVGQAIFYTNWMISDGIGLVATLLACAGIGLLLKHDRSRATAFLFFPVLFTALMLAQKANFTRNVIVLIPVAAALSGLTISWLSTHIRTFGSAALAAVCLIQPIQGANRIRDGWQNIPESRNELISYLSTNRSELGDLAISGELQLPLSEYKRVGVERLDPKNVSLGQLYLQGYDTLVVGPEYQSAVNVQPLAEIQGEDVEQRIQRNPHIRIFNLRPGPSTPDLTTRFRTNETLTLPEFEVLLGNNPPCQSHTPDEEHCWISSRAAFLKFSGAQKAAQPKEVLLSLSLMSPWQGQRVTLVGKKWERSIDMSAAAPFTWMSMSIAIPRRELEEQSGLLVLISQVHSPRSAGLSADSRRLGVALKQAQMNPAPVSFVKNE
ncbi:MAG: hypothetical protein K1X79_00940 [Oligoflexia bacterium]|nr:hypothetical protein [Oligoflexia bacterium]